MLDVSEHLRSRPSVFDSRTTDTTPRELEERVHLLHVRVQCPLVTYSDLTITDATHIVLWLRVSSVNQPDKTVATTCYSSCQRERSMYIPGLVQVATFLSGGGMPNFDA